MEEINSEIVEIPAWDNLELIKLEPEDPPTVLYQGPDAQGARRRPGDKTNYLSLWNKHLVQRG